MIIAAVHKTKWTLDRDHNFMASRKMPRLVPYVVYEAHEKCKVLGHKLESELRQSIAAKLSQLKSLRGNLPKLDVQPLSFKDYVENTRRMLRPANDARKLGSGEQRADVPGKLAGE